MSTDLHKPVYIQIQEYIAEMILSGKLLPETKIASERELSRDLEVSRMTVRRAITELVNEGLLVRRHGAGTFVAKPKVTYEMPELVNYAEAVRQHSVKTARQLLEFGEVPASRRLAESLEIEIGHPLYRVVLLHLANRVPMILERAFLPCERCPDLQEYDLEKTAIYDLLVKVYDVKVACVDQTIEAVAASEITAKQLRVEDGFPLLMVTRIVRRVGDRKPVQYSQDLLRGDYVRIHSVLET